MDTTELTEGLDPQKVYELWGHDGIEKTGTPAILRTYARDAWSHDEAYGKEPRELWVQEATE